MYVKYSLGQEKPFELEFDEYEPLVVWLGEAKSVLNWLRYVSDYSLLELGVSAVDGSLSAIKLVQVEGVARHKMPEQFSSIEVAGVPQFDLSLWGDKKIIDLGGSVELVLGCGEVLLIIDGSKAADRAIQNKSLIFATSGGYPCWISLSGLTAVQINLIKCAVEGSALGGYL